uniref:Trihelix transcription factor GT-3b n=1 Tax=Tanacetum cinerariifolium TaxID=118510 RepID=A0A699JLS5_TANCI|nr:trihelix transcription factor GT-3b [Tanacetum cinerariifolium]
MEQEGMRQQFPYYNELQAIFTGRRQRMLWMESSEGGGSSKKRVMHLSSDDDDENDESDVEKASGSTKKKKKIATSKGNLPDSSTNLKEILEELMKQQMKMETQWMKLYEAKEEERRKMEMEWRRKMESLENERIMLDQRWREREEQRRIREETRSEKLICEALHHKYFEVSFYNMKRVMRFSSDDDDQNDESKASGLTEATNAIDEDIQSERRGEEKDGNGMEAQNGSVGE